MERSRSKNGSSSVQCWSYLVLAAAMLSHAFGEGFTFGVVGFFTMAQAKQYDISAMESSWTAGIMIATSIISAPIAAAATLALSLRALQISGGIVIMLGIGSSAFTSYPSEIRLLFGIVTGFGLSLVRTASTAIVSQHFGEKWINFALSMLMVGSSCGLVAFPMLTFYLFAHFDFSAVLHTFTVCMAVHIICGLTYSQPEEQEGDYVYEERPEYVVDEDVPGCSLRRVFKAFHGVITHIPNWAYLLASTAQCFAVSAFFTLFTRFIVTQKHLSMLHAAQGSMSLGAGTVVGIVAISVTFHIEFDKLLPITITPIVCGSVAMLMTKIENDISYTMLMTLYGLSYGMLLASHMGVYQSKTLEKDERMAFSVTQLTLEALGSLAGPPLTSYIEQIATYREGIFTAASFGIFAGLCFVPILMHKYFILPYLEKKRAEKATDYRIRIGGYDAKHVKYRRILQQEPEKEPLKSQEMPIY